MLDALLEVRPPFDPEKAVEQCAALLRRYGVAKIIGDKYAGEWPPARFAEHGIEFEQCARPKSDLYHDLLPLLNARRIELLNLPRLSAQLADWSGARPAAARTRSTMPRAAMTTWPMRSPAFWSVSTSTAGSR